MNNKEFVNALATRLQKNPQAVKQRIEALVNTMAGMLDEGATLNVQGFGTYEVKKKKERIIIHPITEATPACSSQISSCLQAKSDAQGQNQRLAYDGKEISTPRSSRTIG